MTAIVGALRVVLGMDSSELMAGIAEAQGTFRSFGRQMKSIGQDLSLKVTAPVLALGGLALRTAGGFEAAMNRVEAATGASAEELSQLSDLARELGKSTVFSAGEAADAVEMLAKNGLDAAQILGGALQASLNLAAAGGADLASAADLTTDVLANFKKSVSDLGPVVDGVTGTLIASKFGFDDYRLALAQAGGVAGGLGVSFEDFNAAIAATSPAFASGSDAGTSFKTFLQRLVPASDDAAAAMEELGLEFFDSSGAMKRMGEIAQELQDGFRGLSDEAKTGNLTEIFGTDAMRTAIGLMDAGAEGIARFDAAIRSASAAEQAAARTKGFLGALEQLKGALEELGLAIAESGLLDWATRFVEGLTEVVDRISELDPALLRLGTVIAGVAAAVGPVLIGLGTMSIVIGAISAPVLAAVAAIGALGAAGVALYANWDQLKVMFPNITALVENVGSAIGALASGAVERLRLMLTGLEQVLGGDFSGALQTAGEIVRSTAETMAVSLGAALGFSRDEVMAFGRDVAAAFASVGAAIGQMVTDGIAAINEFGVWLPAQIDGIVAKLAGMAEAMAQVGRDLMAGLLAGLRESWEAVKAWFAGLGDAIPQWVRDKLGIQSPSTVFAEIGANVMEGLQQGLGGRIGTIQEEMQGFAQGLGEIFAGVLVQGASLNDSLRSLGQQALARWSGGLLNAGIGGLFGSLFGGGGEVGALGGLGGVLLKGIPGFASGTDFAPHGLALLGERGPELVRFRGGEQVMNSRRTLDALRRPAQEPVGVRVYVDRDGNWQAAVARIAGGQVDARRGEIVGQSVQAVRQGNAMSARFLGR